MNAPTTDSSIFIIQKDENRTVYQSTTGETWEITGQCIACGRCEEGAIDVYYEEVEGEKFPIERHYQIWTGVPIGQPGACLDSRYGTRLDIPVRPEMPPKYAECTLSGKYLNGD